MKHSFAKILGTGTVYTTGLIHLDNLPFVQWDIFLGFLYRMLWISIVLSGPLFDEIDASQAEIIPRKKKKKKNIPPVRTGFHEYPNSTLFGLYHRDTIYLIHLCRSYDKIVHNSEQPHVEGIGEFNVWLSYLLFRGSNLSRMTHSWTRIIRHRNKFSLIVTYERRINQRFTRE